MPNGIVAYTEKLFNMRLFKNFIFIWYQSNMYSIQTDRTPIPEYLGVENDVNMFCIVFKTSNGMKSWEVYDIKRKIIETGKYKNMEDLEQLKNAISVLAAE